MNNLILVAGGGTGGHIYPAIAIVQKLKKLDPKLSVEFVGTELGLEKKIIPREGYKLHFIKASALNNVGILSKVFSLFLLPFGILQSLFLILKLKPRLVFGVGGYASGPMMLAAILLRKPTAVFESNAHPGFTNRWLAPFVGKAFLNFEASLPFFKKAEIVGFPVREGMSLGDDVNRMEKKSSPGEKFRVLIFGGSQGARGINQTVMAAVQLSSSLKWLENFEIVHQTGATDWAFYDSEYKKIKSTQVKHFEFLYDMPQRYQWADLIVCRAGAATLAELACCGKGAVLIPFPFASDNHQQKNAEALVAGGAAKMIVQKEFTPEAFIQTLDYFRAHPEEIGKLEKSIPRFFIPGAAEKIAAQLLKMSQKKSP